MNHMVAFRCDSSTQIGTGHVYRCLALAEKLRALGHEIVFVCADLPGNCSAIISSRGFELKLVQKIYDVPDVLVNLGNNDYLVIDHYGINEDWESQFFHNCTVFVIDDPIGRTHQCHFLIDVNYRSEQSREKQFKAVSCCQFLGPQYALLQNSFTKQIAKNKMRSALEYKKNNSVIVFFGGSDSAGESLRFIQEVGGKSNNLMFELIVSRNNVHLQKIMSFHYENIKLIIDPQNIAELLNNYKLYFGSGGTITWERMALGLPGVVAAVADNQIQIAEELAAAQQQIYLGLSHHINFEEQLPLIQKTLADESALLRMSMSNMQLVRPIPNELVAAIFSIKTEKLRIRLTTVNDNKKLKQFFESIVNTRTPAAKYDSGSACHVYGTHLSTLINRPNHRVYISEINLNIITVLSISPDDLVHLWTAEKAKSSDILQSIFNILATHFIEFDSKKRLDIVKTQELNSIIASVLNQSMFNSNIHMRFEDNGDYWAAEKIDVQHNA